ESTRPLDPARYAGTVAPHLVVAWSSEQPELIGHAMPVERACVLGRGGAQGDDPAPRRVFCQYRPSGPSPGPQLAGTRLSRRQVLLEPSLDGLLAVTSLGRCPLLLNGTVADRGVVRPGDTVSLQDLLVFVVVSRPADWYLVRGRGADVGFPFGAA